MIGKVNRLPGETQKALKAFACLGNSAEISTLAIIHGRVFFSQEGDEEPDLRSQTSSAFQTTARPQDKAALSAERLRDFGGGRQKRSSTRTCGRLCVSSLSGVPKTPIFLAMTVYRKRPIH